MKSLQGHLLVASPHLPDPNFYRAVVLMVEHQEEGALGLILNRISNTALGDVWEDEDVSPVDLQQRIRIGGPVEGPLMALHAARQVGGHRVVPGVYFTNDPDMLGELILQDETPYYLYLGYAGWGPGQLDGELEAGGWLTMPADSKHVFDCDEERLWEDVVHAIGDEITREALGIKRRPVDPSAN